MWAASGFEIVQGEAVIERRTKKSIKKRKETVTGWKVKCCLSSWALSLGLLFNRTPPQGDPEQRPWSEDVFQVQVENRVSEIRLGCSPGSHRVCGVIEVLHHLHKPQFPYLLNRVAIV